MLLRDFSSSQKHRVRTSVWVNASVSSVLMFPALQVNLESNILKPRLLRTPSVLFCGRRHLRGYLRFKYRIYSYAEPWRQYNNDDPSSLNAYIRLPCSYVQISPFEVNKYSTFIFLTRSVSLGSTRRRWLSEAKTPQEDSASTAGRSRRGFHDSSVRLSISDKERTGHEIQKSPLRCRTGAGWQGGGGRWVVSVFLFGVSGSWVHQ